MYSSRHNHALRRSREGSGRFVGGPVDNSAGVTSDTVSMTSSSLTSYHSDANNATITTSIPTYNYLPFSDRLETPQEPHQATSEGNTNSNNNAEVDFLKSPSVSKEISVSNSEQRGTVITSMAVS